jgi:hypothetical protein
MGKKIAPAAIKAAETAARRIVRGGRDFIPAF